MDSKDTSLRVVLGVNELKELKDLRKKVITLQNELKLWKGNTRLPEVGKYYFAEEKLMEDHGWTFGDDDALRYEGTKEKNVTRCDGTTLTYVAHVFTAPYSCNNVWVTFDFETYQLHQIWEVEWQNVTNVNYLDKHNHQAVWRAE